MLTTLSEIKGLKKAQLELQVLQDRQGKTQLVRSYTRYPYRLSPALRLCSQNRDCLYIYMINTSPGWLAKDDINTEICLGSGAHLFLTDQAASKVHCMPQSKDQANVHTEVSLSAGAFLEWIPEPVILYKDAALQQTCRVTKAKDAGFILSDIMIPGRLARGEIFLFRKYSNRVTLMHENGQTLWVDSNRLVGGKNSLTCSSLMTIRPVSGTLYIVPPRPDLLSSLQEQLRYLGQQNERNMILGISRLPDGEGLIMRSLSSRASWICEIHYQALKLTRNLLELPELPEVPK